MPALPPVTRVVRIRLISTESTDLSIGSSFFLQYSGSAPSAPQLTTFNTSVGTAWAADIAPLSPQDLTLTEVISVDLSSNSSSQAATTVSHAGTRAGGGLPLNVAFSLQNHTQLRRRGGHWRQQLRVGTTTDLASQSNWTSAFVTAVESGWQSFITACETAEWPGAGSMVAVGIQYYGPPNRTITSSTGRVRTVSTLLPTPVVWPITGYGAFPRLGSQRRRLGKSGT